MFMAESRTIRLTVLTRGRDFMLMDVKMRTNQVRYRVKSQKWVFDFDVHAKFGCRFSREVGRVNRRSPRAIGLVFRLSLRIRRSASNRKITGSKDTWCDDTHFTLLT